MLNTLLEILGLALVVGAAATVSVGLAMLIAGLAMVLVANRPPRPTPQPPRR